MDPLTLMLIGAGITAGSQAIGGAIKQSSAKKAGEKMFTLTDEERLAELKRLREEGGLGMSEEQRMAFDAEARAARAAAARESQAERLALQAASPTSSRDVFLQQYATEQARQQGVTSENLARQQANLVAEQQQLAELASLQQAQAQALGLPLASAGQGVAGAGAALGQGLSSYGQQAAQIELMEAQQGVRTDEEILRDYLEQRATENPYESYV